MKKLISLLLALVMCLSVFPAAVFADDGTDIDEPAGELTAAEPEEEISAEIPAQLTAEPDTEESSEETADKAGSSEEESESVEAVSEAAELPADTDASLDEGVNILTPENFPDPKLLSALKLTLSVSAMTAEEAASVRDLILNEKEISDITGIREFFTGVEEIYISENCMTSLDLSGMTSLVMLNCAGNALLESVNVSGCSALKTLFAPKCVVLSELNVSDCPQLTDVNLNRTAMKSLPLADLAGLTSLNVGFTGITELDVSGIPNLKSLCCRDCTLLHTISCRGCSRLSELQASSCALESINISGCSALCNDGSNYSLWLEDNRLTDLGDISGTAIVSGFVPGNQYPLRPFRGVLCDSGVYVDFYGNGLRSDADFAPQNMVMAANSENRGVYVLSTDVLKEGSGFYYDDLYSGVSMSVYPVIELTEGTVFNIPEYILLPGTETGGVLPQISFSDGRLLNPAADGFNVSLSVKGTASAFSITDAGLVPVSAGTGTVRCEISMGGKTIQTADIRVDVTADGISGPATGVTGVSLLQSSVNVDLYSTGYAKLGVVLELEQNLQSSLAGMKPEEAPGTGLAIESAAFDDSGAASWLALVPEGDRSLRIVPRSDRIAAVFSGAEKAPKGFSSSVTVTLSNGDEFTTEAVKLTLKAAKPSVSAKAVVLNSWPGFSPDVLAVYPAINVKNGSVSSITVVDSPDWLLVEESTGRFIYSGVEKAKCSGTVRLLCNLENCAVSPEISIKVSAKPTAPKFTTSVKSVTVYGSGNDKARVCFGITFPKVNVNLQSDEKVTDFEITGITEGRGKTAVPVNTDVFEYLMSPDLILKIKTASTVTGDRNLTLHYRLAGADRSIPVTIKGTDTAVSSLSVKQNTKVGSIDLSAQGSCTGFKVSGVNCNAGVDNLTYNWTVTGPDGVGRNSNFSLNRNYDNGDITLRLTSRENLTAGKYTLSYGIEIDKRAGAEYVRGSCTFSVKDSKGTPSLKITSKGKLEAYSYSSIAFTVSVKNWGYTPSLYCDVYSSPECRPEDLCTGIFVVNNDYNAGVITLMHDDDLTRKIEPGNYYLKVRAQVSVWNGTGYSYPTIEAKPVKFTVKGSIPKLSTSVKELLLSSRDCLDEAKLTLSANAARTVTDVRLDPKSESSFSVSYAPVYGSYNYFTGKINVSLGWKDDLIRTSLAGKTQTVKLNVYLDGVPKPLTVSVKVKVK